MVFAASGAPHGCGALTDVAFIGSSDAGDDGSAASSDSGSLDEGDAEETGDDSDDALPLPSCTATRTWVADFSADPTTLDEDADGTPDWIVRNGQPIDADQLVDGWWIAPANRELDTRPLDDFASRVIVTVRMAAIAEGEVTQFWINADHTPETYTAFFVENSYVAGAQELALYTKPSDFENTLLSRVDAIAPEPYTLSLELDPTEDRVRSWIDGVYMGEQNYVTRPRSSGMEHRFASLVARGDGGSYDSVRIELCAD